MKNTSRILAAVAAIASVAAVACGAPPDGGEETGTTSEAQTCSGCGGTTPPSGSSGGGSKETVTSSTSCTLLQGTPLSYTPADGLPYMTQEAPGGATAGTGWTINRGNEGLMTLAIYQQDTAYLNANCAPASSFVQGLACFAFAIVVAEIDTPWLFENELADALDSADSSVPSVATQTPLLLATVTGSTPWYGVQITAKQAADPGVLALAARWDNYAVEQSSASFAAPEIFQCTVTTTVSSSGRVVSSTATTKYYAGWDPDCTGTNCSSTLSPRTSGLKE